MAGLPQQHRPGSRCAGSPRLLAADTSEPRLCAALRAYAVPSAGHDFMMQPHENPLLAVGFLAVEPRGQLEAFELRDGGWVLISYSEGRRAGDPSAPSTRITFSLGDLWS